MELSITLRTPLDQYVDDYFTSKVKDLSKAFQIPEKEVERVLEFGVPELKRAPSRRSSSSSRESEPSPPPVQFILESSPEPKAPSPSPVSPVSVPSPAPPGVVLSSTTISPEAVSASTCVHPIKGVNPRICGKKTKHLFEHKWYCKTHLKIYTKKSSSAKKKPAKRIEEKSMAKKIWKKKTLEKKFNFVEEDKYYVDTRTRICLSPNSKEALGILPENGDPLEPLREEHLELLAASNLKCREVSLPLDTVLSDSDEELVLLPDRG